MRTHFLRKMLTFCLSLTLIVLIIQTGQGQNMPCASCGGRGFTTCHHGEDTCPCKRCGGSGSVAHECEGFLDVAGLDGIYSSDSYVYGGGLIYLVKAYIRDDGERGFMEPGDIGLHIFYDIGQSNVLNQVRLYGPYFTDLDDDGSCKYEWEDYCLMKYNNFAIAYIPLESQTYGIFDEECISILAQEGDDFGSEDDNVFSAQVCIDDLPEGEVVKVEGNCDLMDRCATLWLCRVSEPNSNSGRFWNLRNVYPTPCEEIKNQNDYRRRMQKEYDQKHPNEPLDPGHDP